MRLAIVSDVYPPLRSSGAVQLRDLSKECARQGHQVTVLVAAPGLEAPCRIEYLDGVRVVRLRTPNSKDVGFARRALAETAMPFSMLRSIGRSPVATELWDGVIWYSPTIFLGPVVSALRRRSGCRTYLIVRDIFPEWAADMGLMGRGLPYRYFRAVARYQYSLADVIGIQTPGNASYFTSWSRRPGKRLEVLHNWLAAARPESCSISVAATPLAGKKIFVYAGNMGVAQGMDVLLGLAQRLRSRSDIGFLFVGRGTEVPSLKERVRAKNLTSVLFHEEIPPNEIAGLYSQCHIGLLSLDHRHRTHNIPGKFLTYMQAGLPVLATVNEGNDIVALIESENVGRVCSGADVVCLAEHAERLLSEIETDAGYGSRCRALADRMFSVERAVAQITRALSVAL